MYGIAFRYNISPDVLMTANPDVNPRAMGVGHVNFLIPVTPMPPSAAATQTPGNFSHANTSLCCHKWSQLLSGCFRWFVAFFLAENNDTDALENVTGVVILEADEETREETALMPLNLFPGGESPPVDCRFRCADSGRLFSDGEG